MMDWNSLLQSAITGLFVGAGSSLGTWLITKHFIKVIEDYEERLKKQFNGKDERNE